MALLFLSRFSGWFFYSLKHCSTASPLFRKMPTCHVYKLCWQWFAVKSASCTHGYLAIFSSELQSGGVRDLQQIFIVYWLQPASNLRVEWTQGEMRDMDWARVYMYVSSEAGTNSTNFKAVIPWECNWVCCYDLIQVFEKAMKESNAIIFEPQLIYQQNRYSKGNLFSRNNNNHSFRHNWWLEMEQLETRHLKIKYL